MSAEEIGEGSNSSRWQCRGGQCRGGEREKRWDGTVRRTEDRWEKREDSPAARSGGGRRKGSPAPEEAGEVGSPRQRVDIQS